MRAIAMRRFRHWASGLHDTTAAVASFPGGRTQALAVIDQPAQLPGRPGVVRASGDRGGDLAVSGQGHGTWRDWPTPPHGRPTERVSRSAHWAGLPARLLAGLDGRGDLIGATRSGTSYFLIHFVDAQVERDFLLLAGTRRRPEFL
jgi:hypothetical protein